MPMDASSGFRPRGKLRNSDVLAKIPSPKIWKNGIYIFGRILRGSSLPKFPSPLIFIGSCAAVRQLLEEFFEEDSIAVDFII
jgi:hypothetical protein